MSAFSRPVNPGDVAELIDLRVEGSEETDSMARLQEKGIAAIHNILCDGDIAYLADEVGMGKTYQALGLASLVWNADPRARILFLSPRENLQQKWFDDYHRFFADNYRRPHGVGDDLVTSVLFREPVHRPMPFGNLRSWTRTLSHREPAAVMLRHPSFARPVYLGVPTGPADVDRYWKDCAAFFERAGLHAPRRPVGLNAANANEELQLAFGDHVNRRLAELNGGRPYFDLVIVDECQCLRKPTNQTNRVLHRVLDGQVAKWLFMSATPVHSSPDDIPTILNHYPGHRVEVVPTDLAGDLPALQEALQSIMVRRPRRYLTGGDHELDKRGYRKHDTEGWAVTDDRTSVLSTLAVGLVQKGLVDVLEERGNRFKLGFLSSFESLDASLRRKEDDVEWEGDVGGGATKESEAPDAPLIERLTTDFSQRFGRSLPHPKIESVVDRIAPRAFGSEEDGLIGGEKFLVFTRRVSTVETLRRELMARHRETIEQRARRVWGRQLDWQVEDEPDDEDVDLDTDDPESLVVDDAERDPFRLAMRPKAWLGRYRNTFRRTGRNAIFFEDGWVRRLAEAGGVDPAAVVIPDEIWAESWTHASRSAGQRQAQLRAERLRYLAVQALRRRPEVFGLGEERAATWLSAYESILHQNLDRAEPADAPRVDAELLTHEGLWGAWDGMLPDEVMLPAAGPTTVDDVESLLQRQVLRTLLSQTLRLTDTIVDLWCADEAGGREPGELAAGFLGWASSDDIGARRLRADAADWKRHLRLILDSCLDGAGRSWRDLARGEEWDQLFEPDPVLGVSGKTTTKRATKQFRTPSLPRVLVCTDTLKEGVDLHLFCDQVVHYGVAWSAGDQEQRVGRVDRYFSQIERRLRWASAPGEVMLEVGYPHVVASMERRQVEVVRRRQERAEALMDSPLYGRRPGDKEIGLDDREERSRQPKLEPFSDLKFPKKGRTVEAVTQRTALEAREYYRDWNRGLLEAVRDRGWNISPGDELPPSRSTLEAGDHQHDLEWTFDAPLRSYVLSATMPEGASDEGFTGGRRRRLREKKYVIERFVQMLVPGPGEKTSAGALDTFLAVCAGQHPAALSGARQTWGAALKSVALDAVAWESDHKAKLTVGCDQRHHRLSVYCYEQAVRIVGTVAEVDQLSARSRSDGTPPRDDLDEWAVQETADLRLGYLDIHPRDGLVFGMHVLHDQLDEARMRDLVSEVAWRADGYESVLTGEDRH